jgi:hypothetical protein
MNSVKLARVQRRIFEGYMKHIAHCYKNTKGEQCAECGSYRLKYCAMWHTRRLKTL